MNLVVGHGPHIRAPYSTGSMMWLTLVVLIPASIYGAVLFGMNALILILVSIFSCVFFEALMIRLRKKEIRSEDIGSAALTGLLIALISSPAAAWWMMIVGAVIAIIIAKHLFGGLGFNIFNPALVARAFLAASWPVAMTKWFRPFDAVTSATHLAFVKSQFTAMPLSASNDPNLAALMADPKMLISQMPSHISAYMQLFLGNRGGCIGETSILLLLLGAILLLAIKIADWRIPSAYLATSALVAISFGSDPIFHLLSGGLVLGAFFMATDPVTSPVSRKGRWVFGIGCGVITMLIRFLGGYPEGVCYAILIMNAFVPLLDIYLPDRIYGHKK